MYLPGFYYQVPSESKEDNDLVICMSDIYNFFLVSKTIIPDKYLPTGWPYNMAFIRMIIPVLCQVEDNHVQIIHFFSDFPYIKTDYINDSPINVDKENSIGFSFGINKLTDLPTLLYNGEPFIKSHIDYEKGRRLTKLLTDFVVAKKQISSLYSEIVHFEHKERFIKDLIKEVEACSLEKILSTLYVEVWDDYKEKLGDDNTYYMYRTAKLLDKSLIIDSYLSKIIGLDCTTCIYETTAYASISWLRQKAKETHPLGVYSGEVLEKEKRRIMSLYSKEEHIAYLLYDQFPLYSKSSSSYTMWKDILFHTEFELRKDYLLDKLSSISTTFFDDFRKQDDEIFLNSLNQYLYCLQKNYPVINVIFAGYYWDKENESRYYEKIGEIVNDLSKKHFVVIITGYAEGCESLAWKYAKENKIEYVYNHDWYSDDGYHGIKRCKLMAEKANLIFLLGDYDMYMSKNFIQVANELNIPIKKIKIN